MTVEIDPRGPRLEPLARTGDLVAASFTLFPAQLPSHARVARRTCLSSGI